MGASLKLAPILSITPIYKIILTSGKLNQKPIHLELF